jgi:hypothetical protein
MYKGGEIMKKLMFYVLLFTILLTGCSGGKDTRDLAYVENYFKENEINIVVKEDKPYFQMIGAYDGVMIEFDKDPVKIYQFASEKAYKEALEQYGILKDMPKNGLLVLDGSNETAIKLFNEMK